ncbi:MAG: T9SS type A sorting domain-containing protein [Saprospiraceae bacterium]|nr:T9SS type A sorting domain-containing protein [Candidatus Brachybacter algidus]
MKKFSLLILIMFCFNINSDAITLQANLTSNNGSGGVFLSLTTNSTPVNITSFNTMYSSTSGTSVTVEIYSRSGAYAGFTASSAGWNLVGTITTTSAGTTTIAPMDVTSLNIQLAASTTTSFYLQSITAGGGIRYFGTGVTSNTNFNDANLALFSDVARVTTVAFGGSQFSPRAYTGTIDYNLNLSADPCASITTITCGTPVTATTTGTGVWSPGSCGFSTPGQEKVYSFTPLTTGNYTFQITAASGGFSDYFFKAASGGCSATGWTCIGDASAPESNISGPLTAGTTYYILYDAESTVAQSQTFNINCLAADPCSSITTISCGTPVTAATSGAGVWEPGSCGFTTPGQEIIYSFTPTVTSNYTLQITAASGGFSDYFFKAASGGCSATGWTCIGDASAPESNIFGPLTAGNTYYILYDAEGTGAQSQTFNINCVAGDPCTGITSLTCGVPVTAVTAGAGIWSPISNSCGFTTPGQEKVYSFTPSASGSYTLQVTAASGGFSDYFFKAASGGCGPTGWTCIGDAAGPESNIFGPLTAGTTYYILYDAEGTAAQSQTFNINCLCNFVPTINVLENSGTPNDGTICMGNFTTLVATGGGTYLWSTGALSNGIIVNPASTTIYTVTVTAPNSCVATATTTVTVVPLPIATASALPNPICSGNTLTLSANGGSTYSWSGPGGFISGLKNPQISNIQTSQSGLYNVTVTNVNGCSATANVSVVVNSTPTGSASATPSIACVGSFVQLSSTGGGTYAWSGPNGFTSTQQNPSILINSYQQAGVYLLTITGLGGCTSSYKVQLKVNYPPIATASHVQSSACANSTLQLLSTGDGSYSWSGPGGFTSTLQNPTIPNATAAYSGLYSVTVTSPNGCTAVATTNVTIVNNPVVTATVDDNSVCEGQTVFLHSSGASSYTWAGPYGYTSAYQHPVINNIPIYLGGQYVVTGKGPTGCTATASVDVFVYGAINGTVSATPNPAPFGSNIQLNATGGTTYLWTGPNGFFSNEQSPLLYNSSYKTAGTYTVIITNEGGCQYTLHVVITIIAPKPGTGQVFEIATSKPLEGFIYPNPANSNIKLGSEFKSSILYSIIDANGNVIIKNQTTNDGMIQINTLTPGIYNVIWSEKELNGGTFYGKFVKVD